MNENLKRILSQKAKIHIRTYLKKWNKFDYECWWLVKDILIDYIKNNNLATDLKENEVDLGLENLIEYLKKTFSNKNKIDKELSKYNKDYYSKNKNGDEMTGKEKALKTAKIKRDRSLNLVYVAYNKLLADGKKISVNNILAIVDTTKIKRTQISVYLKQIRETKKDNFIDCTGMTIDEINEIINKD